MAELAKFLKDHRRILVRLMASGVAAFVLLNVAAFYFTSQPWFCNSCHFMKPYVAAWKTSKHSNIACPKCHYPKNPMALMKAKTNALASTVRYFVGTNDRRPRAEVEDEACLQSGCHQTRLLSGKVAFKQGIVFDHKDHLLDERRGIRLRCTSCHSQIVQGTHISVTESTCFTCHFKDMPESSPVGGCGNCHGAPSRTVTHAGFTLNHQEYIGRGVKCTNCHTHVTRGTGEVPPDRCYACHMERDRQKYDKGTIHLTHVTEHKVECFECHEPIAHGLVDVMQGLNSTCGECHQKQRDIFAGTGLLGIPNSPNPMFLARVSCEGCHRPAAEQHPNKVDLAKMITTCAGCHEKGYGAMLDDWLATAEAGSQSTNALLARVEDALKGASDPSADKRKGVEDTIAATRRTLALLSREVAIHNIAYAIDAFHAARKDLLAALELLNKAVEPPQPLITENKMLRSCIGMCHLGLGRNTTVSFEGTEFPHDRHVGDRGIDCMTCHDNEPQHGKMVIAKAGCSSCHHKNSSECASCHTLQAAMFAGKGDGKIIPSASTKHSPMSDVPCEACHTQKAKPDDAPKAVAEACDQCHDKGLGKITISLNQGTTRKLYNRSLERLSSLGSPTAPERAAAVAAVRAKLETIRRDGSWGVHNKDMVDVLLQESDALINSTANLTGSDPYSQEKENK